MLYSNLTYYTDLKRDEGLAWTVKTDDFFPYGSVEHDYWVGYFTSRPAFKEFSSIQYCVSTSSTNKCCYQSHHSADFMPFQRTIGLVQHHDAVSGTEKQAVTDDYALRLHEALIRTEESLNEILFITGTKNHYSWCLSVNVSICDASANVEVRIEHFGEVAKSLMIYS